MLNCKVGSLYKCIICLTLGFLIGIRLTSFWYNLQNETTTTTTSEIVTEMSSEIIEITNGPFSKEEYEVMPQYLFNTTRILCWILTKPHNHLRKAIHIRHTWGKRCNKLLFMSTEEDDELQSVKLNVKEGRNNLWNKTKEALKYIYDHHYNEADWFLKADDDTYIIMENLRYLLYSYPSDIPIYFGAKFKPFVKQGYMSGGAGYVLSRESLKKFALEAYENHDKCPKIFKSEDVQLGFCLQNIGVRAGDSRDNLGKERFIPLALEHLIPTDTSFWYKNYTYYSHDETETCCSSSAVSFHYVKPYQFYILDYLLYTLSPFGILGNFKFNLPKKLNISNIDDLLALKAH